MVVEFENRSSLNKIRIHNPRQKKISQNFKINKGRNTRQKPTPKQISKETNMRSTMDSVFKQNKQEPTRRRGKSF
jgi:hypothetical protein